MEADMARGDNVIYIINGAGERFKVGKPICSEKKANFLITWNNMDWSGFRTLSECTEQISIMRDNGKANMHLFEIVERL
jgi:hypothetical protein